MFMYVCMDVKPNMPFTMSDLVERGRFWILFQTEMMSGFEMTHLTYSYSVPQFTIHKNTR